MLFLQILVGFFTLAFGIQALSNFSELDKPVEERKPNTTISAIIGTGITVISVLALVLSL